MLETEKMSDDRGECHAVPDEMGEAAAVQGAPEIDLNAVMLLCTRLVFVFSCHLRLGEPPNLT